MRARGRATALLAGLAVAALLILGALSWPALALRWHLSRLRAEPGYLESILDAPKGTPAGEAVERFMAMPETREKVLSEYVALFFKASGDLEQAIRGSECDVYLSVKEDGELRWVVLLHGSRMAEGLDRLSVGAPRASRLEAFQEAVARCGEPLSLPAYPARKFRFFRQGHGASSAFSREQPTSWCLVTALSTLSGRHPALRPARTQSGSTP